MQYKLSKTLIDGYALDGKFLKRSYQVRIETFSPQEEVLQLVQITDD